MGYRLDRGPVAVIGLACRYPGADDPAAYWRLACAGESKIGPLSGTRWDWSRYEDVLRGPRGVCRRAAMLEERPFSCQRYRIPPLEQARIHRLEGLLVEVVDEALRDAGALGAPVDRARVALFAGLMGLGLHSPRVFTMRTRLPRTRDALEAAATPALGPAGAAAAADELVARFEGQMSGEAGIPDWVAWTAGGIALGRVCNALDIRGPHVVLDCGEASALAAIDLAVRQLQQHEQDVAVVAAAAPVLSPLLLATLGRMGWLAADDVRPFDRQGTGSLVGEGAGAIVLCRLDDALRAGARVDAVLRGVGSAAQGRARVATAPDTRTVALAMARAYASAGYGPGDVDLLETHGAGHPGWDRVELEAMQQCFQPQSRATPLRLGAVKRLIGNQLAGAGMAGLLKIILALRARTLPPEQGPAAPLDGLGAQAGLLLERAAAPWPAPGNGAPRRAAVTALSLSGTHYHLTLEELHETHTRGPGAATSSIEERPAMGIAIVAVGAVLPGAADADAFWRNLAAGRCSVTEVPAERWQLPSFERPYGAWCSENDTTLIYLRKGGYATEFRPGPLPVRLPPRLIESLDRSHLWTLECVRQAFATLSRPPASRTAVILGYSPKCEREGHAEFRTLHAELDHTAEAVLRDAGLSPEQRRHIIEQARARATADLPPITEDTLPGYQGSSCAGLVSFVYDLTGPALAVDSACASSLAAVEAACRLLAAGDCDGAVVGGAWANLTAEYYNLFCCARILTPDGQDPFGPAASGFMPAEGAAVMVLKREEDARRDGDRILAVIRGVAGSSDGRGTSIYAVSARGLHQAVSRALDVSGVDPGAVAAIEAHGISVPVGDLAELATYARFYGRAGRVAVSSFKSSIGHVHAAAGAAAMVKAALSLDRGTLLPVTGFRTLHPDVDLDGAALRVLTEPTPWYPERPRCVAVTCYGMGGTNYHAVLEAAPSLPRRETDAQPPA